MLTFTLRSATSQACGKAKRRIGFAHNSGAKSFVMCGKLRFGAACPRTRARLSCSLPAPEKFVDIGHADTEDRRCGINACSRIHFRHDTFAQVPRVSSSHLHSPTESTAKGITNIAPPESSGDSINSEDALARIFCKFGRRRRLSELYQEASGSRPLEDSANAPTADFLQ